MNNKYTYLKKILSYFPLINSFVRKTYYSFNYGSYFIPVNLKNLNNDTLKEKVFKLTLHNFYKFQNEYSYFLIFNKKSISHYSHNRFKKLTDLLKDTNSDMVYDGDEPSNIEIVSLKILKKYINTYSIQNYPHKFFYIKNNFNIKNIGSDHRSYNFNGSFSLPSGGITIGDGGPVENRLNYIPNLKGKSFLDIGSEEGYAVFQAIKRGAKFAKGLNIDEDKEYDYFPESKRPSNITLRKRSEIEKTQNFLLNQYGYQNYSNIKFEYQNIYYLSEEKFDCVFCFGVLYHLKNPYLALENLYKVTNETLIIETQGIKNDSYLNAKISKEDGFVRHSSKALAFLLKRAGFKKVDVMNESYDKSMKVQNIVLKAEKD